MGLIIEHDDGESTTTPTAVSRGTGHPFRLLDAAHVKKALQAAAGPLILVIWADIHRTVVRHGYDGIDQRAFHPLVRVNVAGHRYPGWIHILAQPAQHQVTELVRYRQPV